MIASFDVLRDAAARVPMPAQTEWLVQENRERRGFAPMEQAILLSEDVRVECAAAACDAQPRFWKKSARPVFEGQWSCSPACREELIAAAIRRCIPAAAEVDTSAKHRHRIPIGLLLLERGLITQAQLRQALDAQQAAGHGRVGEWLQKECGVPEVAIARGLAAQWSRPVLSRHGLVATTMAQTMPAPLRAKFGMLPLRVAGGRILYVGFKDGVSPSVVRMLERMSGLRVETGVMPDGEFAAASEELDRRQRTVLHEVEVKTVGELGERISRALNKEQPVASRLVAAHGSWWLRLWLERGALGAHGFLPATGEDVVDYLFHLEGGAASLMSVSLDSFAGV